MLAQCTSKPIKIRFFSIPRRTSVDGKECPIKFSKLFWYLDKSKTVILYCNCREEFGLLPGIKKIVPCKWEFIDDQVCPDVPQAEQFDWQCDPRIGDCPYGQYHTQA